MSDFEKIRNFLEKIEHADIRFKKHFYYKVKDRPISEELVREYLKKIVSCKVNGV